jgi:hypothetical protein
MASSVPGTGAPSVSPCVECGAPLATDQAYCIQCGARRGPLPARVAVALSDIEDHGRPIAPEDVALADPQPEDEPENVVSAARAGVIGLLVMLAFGVLIGGAFSSGGLGALANTIVVAVRPGVQQAAQVVTTVAPQTGGGGGQGPPRHFGGGGGGGGGATAAATVPASPAQPPVTVTVSESQSTNPGTGTTPQATLPSINHVWLIVLGQQGYQQAWATSAGHPYLGMLRKSGELVTNYDAVASSPLANEVALLSGQGPTQQTTVNCPSYTYIDPGKIGKQQQVLGDGCIYPQTTETLPQQFVADGLTWKAYIQGIGEGGCAQSGSTTSSSSSSSSSTTPTVPAPPVGTTSSTTTSSSSTTSAGCSAAGTDSSTTTTPAATSPAPTTPTTPAAASPAPGTTTPATGSTTPGTITSSTSTSSTDPVDTIGEATCPHPALNSPSLNQSVTADSTYVNWKNPVIYFQGLLLPSGLCQTNDVGIGQLATDLKNPGATPTLSYISPDPCDDGSDTPCRPGAKAGLAQADTFLQQVVPKIERSASYQQGGLILITFASAPQSGPHWDTSSCCGQPTFPNLPDTSTSGSSTSTSPSATSTSPSATTTSTAPTTTPVVTATETVTTTTATPSGSPTATGTSPDCAAAGSVTSSSSTSPSVPTTPAAPTTTSASTTTSSTTTPGECGPVIIGTPPGGGQVGLLMISPWIDPNKTDVVDTLNHFSVLKGIEQLFKLPNLGYAKVSALQGFGLGMFASSKH